MKGKVKRLERVGDKTLIYYKINKMANFHKTPNALFIFYIEFLRNKKILRAGCNRIIDYTHNYY